MPTPIPFADHGGTPAWRARHALLPPHAFPSGGSWLAVAALPSQLVFMAAPLRAFPSWYLRMECASCGREKYLAETHLTIAEHGGHRVGDLIGRLKH